MLNRILICETQRRLFYGWLPPRSVNLIIAHPLLHSSQSHVFRTLVHCFHLTHHHWPWLGDGWRLSTILYSWNIEKMRRLHESISGKLSNKTVNWQYVYVWRVSGWKLYSRDCSLVYELVSGSHASTDCIMGLTTILTTNHWWYWPGLNGYWRLTTPMLSTKHIPRSTVVRPITWPNPSFSSMLSYWWWQCWMAGVILIWSDWDNTDSEDEEQQRIVTRDQHNSTITLTLRQQSQLAGCKHLQNTVVSQQSNTLYFAK